MADIKCISWSTHAAKFKLPKIMQAYFGWMDGWLKKLYKDFSLQTKNQKNIRKLLIIKYDINNNNNILI